MVIGGLVGLVDESKKVENYINSSDSSFKQITTPKGQKMTELILDATKRIKTFVISALRPVQMSW